MQFRKCNGEECDSNEFLSLDSNVSGKSTSSDNSASGKLFYILVVKLPIDYRILYFNQVNFNLLYLNNLLA